MDLNIGRMPHGPRNSGLGKTAAVSKRPGWRMNPFIAAASERP